MLQNFNNYELVSIAYVAGQLFHLKYYLIFGIPSIFAKIDGMQPNPSPICISHVAKYSQMRVLGVSAGLRHESGRQVDHFSCEIPEVPRTPRHSPLCSIFFLKGHNLYIQLINYQFKCKYQKLNFYLNFPIFRKILATLSVFIFVLIWHGFNSNFCWWVSLSAFGLFIERLANSDIFLFNFIQKNILLKNVISSKDSIKGYFYVDNFNSWLIIIF
uniref:Uncharacterized protein n=1 Tax=Meloidogyne incognita TaxID=6306 RepID=A0A914KZH4_MELIC